MLGRDLQVYFGIRSGQKSGAGVIEVNFREQRPGGCINRLGRAHQLSRKSFAGEFRQGDVRAGLAWLYALGVFFRNVDVDTKSACLRHVEEVGFGSGGAAGVYQVANIRVSRRDDSVEWCVDFLE